MNLRVYQDFTELRLSKEHTGTIDLVAGNETHRNRKCLPENIEYPEGLPCYSSLHQFDKTISRI